MLRIFKQYYPIRNIFFVLGEAVVIFSAVFLASYVRFGTDIFVIDRWLFFKTLLITCACQTCLYYNDLYDLGISDTVPELTIRLFQSLGASAIILAGIYFLVPSAIIGRGIFLVSIGFVVVFLVSWRILYKKILEIGLFDQRIIILGAGALARSIIKEINHRKDCGYIVSAIALDEDEDNFNAPGKNIELIRKKGYGGLCDMAKALGIRKIVVALREKRGTFPAQELLKCRVDGIEVLEGTSFYEMLTGKLIVDHINPAWLIFSDGFQKSRFRLLIKRISDLIMAFILLLLLLPIFGIIALLIKIDRKRPDLEPAELWRWFARTSTRDGVSIGRRIRDILLPYVQGYDIDNENIWERFRSKCRIDGVSPSDMMLDFIKADVYRRHQSKNSVFFSQERLGQRGKKYWIYKFRSMVEWAEEISGGPTWAKSNDKRVTRVGRLIRKWRLDEIPQLWNVLKGEMSFVGPRPEREYFVRQLEKTLPYYRERLTVKPGITGWAQVSYGYGASEDDAREKLNYDLFYIKNMSIFMDMMILLKTVKIVLFGKGAR